MKVKLFAILVISFLLHLKCYAQSGKYADIHDYLFAHCKPSDTVTNQCGWQLAMIKVKTNNQGKVIDYSFLNPASDMLKAAFIPLLHYKFPPKLNMQNKTFVFAQTYYNLRGKCTVKDLPDVQNVFEMTYQCFIKQLKLDPQTIFDDIIFATVGNDERVIDKRP